MGRGTRERVADDHGEPVEAKASGNCGRFKRNACVKIGGGGEEPSAVIDEGLPETCGEHLFCQAHADSRRNALSGQAGCHADRVTISMVSGNVVFRRSCQTQKGMKQGRKPHGGDEESIAVRPCGGRWIKAEKPLP
ncbi:hypothetical protein AA23498_2597 [Acetobacter nitrogenifigens DSM 23921 = NBRC 105050]|nr:hypothetical protein AA23498_2597 [Acetobacter nitrogenifigens DSM 23921 = NBRC 105050]